MSEYLRYGAIGLGLALAVLAFLLLQQEQKIAKPRKEIIKTIYVFMGFALVLSIFGFSLEHFKSSQEAAQLGNSTESTNKLARVRAASVPLLNARVPVIESLPDDLPQKKQLLVFQAELQKILSEEGQR